MGTARREPVAWQQPGLGPWHGEVKVTPLALGDRTDFEVAATWHGPPQQGFPPDDRPGHRTDTIQVSEYELAREIAIRAVEQLRTADTWPDGCAKVDLRELLRAATGRAHGTLILPSGAAAIDPVAGPEPDPRSGPDRDASVQDPDQGPTG